MFDIEKFGKGLTNIRKKSGLTQNDVAYKLNLTRQAISKYERGESFPDISVLLRIAELFGMTISELINFGEPSKAETVVWEKMEKGNADIDAEELKKLMPLLNSKSKEAIFQKILNGEMDWRLIKILIPYADNLTSQIEAAVVAGVLPGEVLDILQDYFWDGNR